MTPDFNAQNYVQQVFKARRPADIEAIFADIAKLPEANQTKAVDAVEGFLIKSFKADLPNGPELAQLKGMISMIDGIKNTPQGKMMLANVATVEESQMIATTFLKVSQVKGDAADPVVKSFVAEAAKLSDEDYNSPIGLMKIMVGVATAGEPAAPVNPFRRTPKP